MVRRAPRCALGERERRLVHRSDRGLRRPVSNVSWWWRSPAHRSCSSSWRRRAARQPSRATTRRHDVLDASGVFPRTISTVCVAGLAWRVARRGYRRCARREVHGGVVEPLRVSLERSGDGCGLRLGQVCGAQEGRALTYRVYAMNRSLVDVRRGGEAASRAPSVRNRRRETTAAGRPRLSGGRPAGRIGARRPRRSRCSAGRRRNATR